MTTWAESSAIEMLTRAVSSLEKGWEDTTVVRTEYGGAVVLSTDQINVAHAYPGEDVRSLVRRGVTEAISDVAAAGARLHGVQIDVRAPSDFALADFEAIGLGVDDVLRVEGGVLLQGSNISRGEFGVSTTAVGACTGHFPPLRRSGAEPGDLVALSGPVGAWDAALSIINQRMGRFFSDDEWNRVMTGFVDYRAEMAYGALLQSSGLVTSCIDANDQVGKSLADLARASNHSVQVSAEAIPVSEVVLLAAQRMPNLDILDTAIAGISGDDRLIFTFAPADLSHIRALLKDEIGRELHVIGHVSIGGGATIVRDKEKIMLPLRKQPSIIYSQEFSPDPRLVLGINPAAGRQFWPNYIQRP